MRRPKNSHKITTAQLIAFVTKLIFVKKTSGDQPFIVFLSGIFFIDHNFCGSQLRPHVIPKKKFASGKS